MKFDTSGHDLVSHQGHLRSVYQNHNFSCHKLSFDVQHLNIKMIPSKYEVLNSEI